MPLNLLLTSMGELLEDIYLTFAYWQHFLCISTFVMNFTDICAEKVFIGICTEILELNQCQSLKISYQWSNEINCMNFQLKIQLNLGHQRIFQWFSSEVLSTVSTVQIYLKKNYCARAFLSGDWKRMIKSDNFQWLNVVLLLNSSLYPALHKGGYGLAMGAASSAALSSHCYYCSCPSFTVPSIQPCIRADMDWQWGQLRVRRSLVTVIVVLVFLSQFPLSSLA